MPNFGFVSPVSTALYDYDNHVRAGSELRDQVLDTVALLEQIMGDNQVRGRVELLAGFFSSRVNLKHVKSENPDVVVVPGRERQCEVDDADFKYPRPAFCLTSKTGTAVSWAGLLVKQSPVPVLVVPAGKCVNLEEAKSCSESPQTSTREHGQHVSRLKRISSMA